MNITLLQLLTFTFAVFIFVMTPGPGVFATISKSMSQGWQSALPLAIGLAAGEAIYMTFSAYGLSALATNFHTLFTVIKYAGAAYLFYLAYKMWTTVPPEIGGNNLPVVEKNKNVKSISSGLLIAISNPKVILFYLSILPSFFPVQNLTGLDVVTLTVLIFTCAIIGIMIYAIMAGYARQRLKSPKSRQNFNRAGASFMGLAGTWLVAKG